MLKISRPARSLLLLGFISCLVLFTLTSRFDLLDGQTSRRHLQSRQIIIGPDEKTTSAATSATATATQPTATSQQAPTSTQQTSPTQSQPTPTSANPPTSTSTSESTSATTSSTSSLPAETSSAPPPTSAPPAQTSAQPTPTPVPSTSASLSTGANGEVETIIVTTLVTPSSTSSSVAPSQTSNEDNDNTGSKGVGTSTIVGLSVAGGIALIVVVGFVVWKFTRKRANDDFDDSELFHLHDGVPSCFPFKYMSRVCYAYVAPGDYDCIRTLLCLSRAHWQMELSDATVLSCHTRFHTLSASL